MRWSKFILSILPLFTLLLLPLSGQNRAWAGNTYMGPLEAAVNSALVILQDKSLSAPSQKDARRTKLRAVLYPHFNFARMSRGSVGRKWNKFSTNQQERFVTLFKKLLENTYMGMIERYQGEQVVFTKELKQSETIVRVDSIILSKGQKYDMSYRLGKDGEKWRVFDVIIEGVSVVANYRSQFRQLLRKRNPDIEGMLSKLKVKVSKAK